MGLMASSKSLRSLESVVLAPEAEVGSDRPPRLGSLHSFFAAIATTPSNRTRCRLPFDKAGWPGHPEAMSSPSSTSAPFAEAGARFRTTHWSAVVAAQSPGPAAKAALESLCRGYWRPVFAHVRRQGHDVETARDLTQEFFARLLEGRWLQPADPQRGRFRSFLLKCLSRFLIDEWRRDSAQKRGGGHEFFSLDEAREEEHWGMEPADTMTPERAYDRRWAEALIARANASLRAAYESDGQAERFQALKVYLLNGHEPASYADVAGRLGLTVPAVKSAIYKLRQRYGETIRAEIAHTVSRPEEVERELAYLLEVLGS
jgi:RNA polymerase sigma factor (sigma-70 family)